ncbi:hypothetical protein LH128_15426 [Sphingomonas sp. LH128]|uniref:hypothetical protein n=1 Tax=Sphingomonas sp. LH128 TaxID=473781 RepID=UPI00027CB1F5|nr:hypothetical protein [Sphingomonas sp. LH128]EJU12130.1 hypothetical protein LH128_15426 [Sphingomonas sp. LH128]
MLTIALLLLAGFIVGVALTAMFALLYIGVIHAEAVRIVDTHLAGIAMPTAGPVMTMRQMV